MLKLLTYIYLCSASASHLSPKSWGVCTKVALRADAARLDPLEVIALSYAETRHREDLTSPAGAKGALQALPKYWRCEDAPTDHICAGLKAWRYYRSRSRNAIEAVGRYNGGGTDTRYARTYRKHLRRLRRLNR